MLKPVGASGQISLGKKYAGQFFEMESLEDGALLLKPMRVVPASAAWAHEPGMQKRLAAADQWMDQNSPAATSMAALERRAAAKDAASNDAASKDAASKGAPSQRVFSQAPRRKATSR